LRVLLVAIVVNTAQLLPAPVSAVSPVQSLPIGSYWRGNGTMQKTLQGKGSYDGIWSEYSRYTRKFTIVNHNANEITISEEYWGSWSITATSTWVKRNGGESKEGTIAPVRVDYMINLTTMKVTAVSSKTDFIGGRPVGHLTWLLIDPQNVYHGRTVSLYRAGFLVPFEVVASQVISINGASVDTWLLSYAGSANGTWHVGNNYAKGNETDTFLYDKTYCIAVGSTNSGSFIYTEEGGRLTETLSYYFRISDSNLAFAESSETDRSHPVRISQTVQGMLVAIVVVLAALVLVLVSSHQPWRMCPHEGTMVVSGGLRLRQSSIFPMKTSGT